MNTILSNLDLSNALNTKTLVVTSLGLFTIATYSSISSLSSLYSSFNASKSSPNSETTIKETIKDLNNLSEIEDLDETISNSSTITDTTLTPHTDSPIIQAVKQLSNRFSDTRETANPTNEIAFQTNPINTSELYGEIEPYWNTDTWLPEEEIIVIPELELPYINIVPPHPAEPFSQLVIQTHSIQENPLPFTPNSDPSPLTGNTLLYDGNIGEVIRENGFNYDEINEITDFYTSIGRPLPEPDIRSLVESAIQTEAVLQFNPSLVDFSMQTLPTGLDMAIQANPTLTDASLQVTPLFSTMVDMGVQAIISNSDVAIQAVNSADTADTLSKLIGFL